MGFLPQQPPAIAQRQPSDVATDSSMAALVPDIYWSVPARGPLLIIGAEKYILVNEPKPLDFFNAGLGGIFGALPDMAALTGQKKPAVTPLGAAPRSGWNPNEIASRFGGQLIRCGTVTTFAPLLLPDKSKSSNPLADGDLMEMMQDGMAMGMGTGGSRLFSLLASLTPNQIQQAGSSNGLPLSSLDNKQRALAQPLIRRTLQFRFAQAPNFPEPGFGQPPPVIPQSDQNQFRLRLSRALSLAPNLPELTAGGNGARISMQFGNLVQESGATRETIRTLALKSGKTPNPMAILAMLGAGSQKSVPARRKPTELNTDTGSLNAMISLVGVTTVDELVGKIALATRLPLVADQRIGKLRVRAKGTSARAGDLVQALCWAIGGAVRRISDEKESVYLLTEQVAIPKSENPLSAIMGPVTGMMQDQRSAERAAKDAKIRLIRQAVLKTIPRGSGTSFNERFWQVAETKPGGDANQIPLVELPPDLQKQAEERHKAFSGAFAAIPEGTPGITRRDPQPLTHIRCGQNLVLELVAPTLGAVATLATTDAGDIHPELPIPTAPPAVTLPASLKQRALSVMLPNTEAQAQALIASAVSHGLTEIRVSVAVSKEKELELLGAAAKGKLRIVAVLAPLEPLTAESPRDRSWGGQSLGEWLASPESTKLLASMPPQLAPSMTNLLGQDYVTPEGADLSGFVARAKRLLALPGVTEFALESLAAPGYREISGGGMGDAMMFFWQGGANAKERVAFAKEQKSDAAETATFNFMDLMGGMGSRSNWTKRTTARSDAFLKRLDAALVKASLSPSSVLVSGEPPRWEKWTGKFPTGRTPIATTRPALKVIGYSRLLAQPAMLSDASDFAGFDEPDQFAGVLGKELSTINSPEAGVRWDGLVLDFSDQPLETALALLDRAVVKV